MTIVIRSLMTCQQSYAKRARIEVVEIIFLALAPDISYILSDPSSRIFEEWCYPPEDICQNDEAGHLYEVSCRCRATGEKEPLKVI